MNDTDALQRLMLAISRLENGTQQQMQQAQQVASGLQQLQTAQAELGTLRQVEEGHFRQAMVQLFQEQQRNTEAALRPLMAKAWWGLLTVAAGFVMLYVGAWLLLNHEYQRLKDAQARADAAQLSAEVRQASQHVVVTSCGGHPCIRIDKTTPTWKSGGKEYVLVDGTPAK